MRDKTFDRISWALISLTALVLACTAALSAGACAVLVLTGAWDPGLMELILWMAAACGALEAVLVVAARESGRRMDRWVRDPRAGGCGAE